jgi:adenylate cyclase
MKPPARFTPEALLTCVFILIGIAWGGFLGARHVAGVDQGLDGFENSTVDWRFSLVGTRPAPRGVVIVAIDDDTVREAGGYPLPRSVLARIIRGLAAQMPQVVAVDVLFLDPGNPGADSELAEALRSTKSVVAGMAQFERSVSGLDAHIETGEFAGLPIASNVLWPIPLVRNATRIGLVNLAADQSGVPRYVPMMVRFGQSLLPSFALAAASVALNTEPQISPGRLKLAARPISMDLGYHLPIRYYGQRGSFKQLSALRVLHGDLTPDEVRGQTVVVGANAAALGDSFATPYDQIMPGVEVLATAISNVLAGDGLVRTSAIRRVDASIAILLPCIAVLLMAIRRAWLGLALVAILLTLWVAATFAAFLADYWLSIAIPLTAALPVATGYGSARLALDRHARTRLEREKAALSKFQSPHLIEHILNHQDFLQTPVHQDAAIVFLDLSRFTEVAETLGPQWTRDLVADFQTLTERRVVEHGGYVGTFMGDGAMTIFGLPQPKPDDASRAMLAIAQLHKSITAWLGTLPPVARDRLGVRIGGHVGPVVVSRLGPTHHQHVTATGDTVNVASRLLEVAKQQSASIVVSEALYKAANLSGLVDDTFNTVATAEVSIRGRMEPLRIRAWG